MLVLLLVANGNAQGVRVIVPTGDLNFSEIQDAIHVAGEGDVILVGQGNYSGFSIDGKSVSIVGNGVIDGTVTVSNLGAQQQVWLDGLRSGQIPKGTQALRLSSNLGHVRIQNCRFTGGNPGAFSAGAAVVVSNSTEVSIVDSFLTGGGTYFSGSTEDGGDGLAAFNSSIALFNSPCTGGVGGTLFMYYYGGHGGDGASLNSGSLLFASGSGFRGGQGGEGWGDVFTIGTPGNGGNGLFTAGEAHLQSCSFVAGQPGVCTGGYPCNPTSPGCAVCGSSNITQYGFTPRRLSVANRVVGDQGDVTVLVTGSILGDQQHVISGVTPTLQQSFFPFGVWMVQGILRRGTSGINTTGSSSLNLNLHLGPLASNMTHRLRFMQGYTLAPNGDRLLGNPVNLVVLNKDSKPDCNENGIQDYYEVIVNPGIDLNNNLIPDSCEP